MINVRRQLAEVYQQAIDIVQEGSYTSVNGEEVELLDNEPIKRVLEKQKTYLLSSTLYW